jgi:hypothetical protein
MANPGNMEIQGAVKSCSRAVESIPPQLGVGGCAPRPRKGRKASERIRGCRIGPVKPLVTAERMDITCSENRLSLIRLFLMPKMEI